MNTKETNIQRSISEKILTYTSFFLLGMQFLFLIYANLKLIPETLDNDVAKLFLHIIKMWEHKTLFVPDWPRCLHFHSTELRKIYTFPTDWQTLFFLLFFS